MKIRYNIANNKQMNYLRFIIISGLVVLLSFVFIFIGITNLRSSAKQFEDKKFKLNSIEKQLEETNKKNKEQKDEIENIKKKWEKKLSFVNSLIYFKIFPHLNSLDQLEKLLPPGVFISKLSIDSSIGKLVEFTIAAVSSSKLSEAYNVFLKKYNDASIKKESLKDGLYTAIMKLKLD